MTAAKEGDQDASFVQLSKLPDGASMVELVDAAPTQLVQEELVAKEDVFAPLFSLIPVLSVDHLPDCSRPEVKTLDRRFRF